MTPNTLHAAFQRLEPGRDGLLEFAYMGVTEYEGGVCAAALNALVSGVAPLETTETRIVLTEEDLPLRARDRREAQIPEREDRVLDALRGLRSHSLGDPGFVNQGIRNIMNARAAEAFSL